MMLLIVCLSWSRNGTMLLPSLYTLSESTMAIILIDSQDSSKQNPRLAHLWELETWHGPKNV